MINRDGCSKSVWQDKVKDYEPKITSDHALQYDVIIVGGGITGLSTALNLQKAGKRCILLEAENICFGTTGGTTAHLNNFLDTPFGTIKKNFNAEAAQAIADASKEAIEFIRLNIAAHAIDCEFEDAEAVLFARDEKQDKELKEIASDLAEFGVKNEVAKTLPIAANCTSAIRIPGQAKFIPVRYVQGLAKAFEEAGGTILQHCRVTGADGGDTIKVSSSQGNFTGRSLVYATHIPPNINLLHLRCAPYRSYAMAVTLKSKDYPKELIYDLDDPYHYYRSQVIDKQPYLIVGGFDHKTGEEDKEEQQFLKLETHIRDHFDIDEVCYKWSSQYFEPADGIAYIGHLPGASSNIFTATGFGGNGMIYGTIAAKLLTDIICEKENLLKDILSPARIKPVAGFVNFMKHNADVVKDLVGSLLPHHKLRELVELAPGEAAVVKYDGKKIALYKDDKNNLHALSPRCTHMGCEVKWNSAEKSWDCPCHGARYSINGDVLTGPTVKPLEKIDLTDTK